VDVRVQDRVAVVTGAGRGIGLAVTRALCDAGATVVAVSRSVTAELEELARSVDVTPVAADVAHAEDAVRVAGLVAERYGRVDILGNNAAILSEQTGGFLTLEDDEWRRLLEENLGGVTCMCRATRPGMVERGGPTVNVASLNAREPTPADYPYSVSKAALNSLTKALAEEFGPRGVRVNTVSPGPVLTPMWTKPGGNAERVAAQFGEDPTELLQRLPRLVGMPIARFARPEEVADLVLFLASEHAAMMTGAEVVIDGGMLKSL